MSKKTIPGYKALEWGDIEEGRFMRDMNSALLSLQRSFIRTAHNFGTPCKAVLVARLTLDYDPDEKEPFSIAAEIKRKFPDPPASRFGAREGVGGEGEPVLLVPKSGAASGDPPGQLKLCTADGRTIDPDTGEVTKNPPEA